ncbi:MAG: tRNA uridine-5-carboxymethylaminomethyl(34) synthesis GTPase MnmE [Treponema sp.]|jgi:tRNA modification GTPase|nr:tRNA uridine-5-carboxymethylaminomethyl(34) synthesis GTPase MnmE [Treponema sp.]
MPKPCYGDENPIAALATAPGESALALIRCSGAGCVELLSKVFSRPVKLRSAGGNSVVHGWIQGPRNEGSPLFLVDEVLISVYRAPRSYTGEEGADISCHGGIATVRALMDVLRTAGFRDSLPGEFSFRGFMNGKLDLTRSESVMELVQARTDEGRRHAVARLSGRLREEVSALKGSLLEILAETELHLDYDETELSLPGEAEEGLPGRERVEGVLKRLRTLAGTWGRERLYQEGALAVIAGRPNAGKSSLFNALLGEDRSIVTEIPGTTRDWIEATVSIGGIPLRLADTAGLRGAGESGAADQVERIGIQKSRELLEQADLVLYVIDGSRGLRDDKDALPTAPGTAPFFLLWNKADIAPDPPPGAFLPLSAKTGQGLAELCGAIAGALERRAGPGGELSRDGAALGTERQKELVDRAAAALEETLNLANRGEALELIAPCLREAVDALGEITGEVSTAEILETIFSKFCVGK